MLDPPGRPGCRVDRPQNAFARRCDGRNNGRVTDLPAAALSTTAPGNTALDPAVAALLKRDDAGLVAAVVQDEASRDVLMVGW
jgi:hypothetical protein